MPPTPSRRGCTARAGDSSLQDTSSSLLNSISLQNRLSFAEIMINQILFFSKAANEQPIKCLSYSEITKGYSWSDNHQLFNSTGMALEGQEVCDQVLSLTSSQSRFFFPTSDHHHILTACSQDSVPSGVGRQGALVVPQGQGMGCPGDGVPTAPPHPAGQAGHPWPASPACLVVLPFQTPN